MKYLFIVQGEGRGHMTQAISLKDMLTKAGHEVVSVMIGKSEQRVIPQFFYNKIGVRVHSFESPNFVTDSSNKSIKVGKSFAVNLKKTGLFLRNLRLIHNEVKEKKPDIIINFYDLMGGLYNFFYRPQAKFICVAHQFLAFHPEFKFPPNRKRDRHFLILLNNIITLDADKRLALSFAPMPDIIRKKTVVVPPLLRQEVLLLKEKQEDFFLVYILNAGYAEEIKEWHAENPNIKIHCFWDQKDAPEELRFRNNLTFHKINDQKFLDYMSRCKALVCTAGFESICEAMYLSKPVMMVPTGSHYEQECNALDALKAGAGMQNNCFKLSEFLDYLVQHKKDYSKYKKWADSAEVKFLKELK